MSLGDSSIHLRMPTYVPSAMVAQKRKKRNFLPQVLLHSMLDRSVTIFNRNPSVLIDSKLEILTQNEGTRSVSTIK